VYLSAATGAASKMDPDKIVGVWLLDDGSGAATDLSGNGLDADLNGGAAWDEGKFGGAVHFADGGDSIAISLTKDFPPGDLTIVAWMKVMEANRLAGGGGAAEYVFTKDLLFANLQDWSVCWKSANVGMEIWTGFRQDWLGEWKHLAFVNHPDEAKLEKYMAIYTDGERVARARMMSSTFESGPADFRIGGDPSFIGAIDEVAIFRAALTDDEIVAIMQKRLAAALYGLPVAPAGKLTSIWSLLKAATQ